MNVSNVMLWDVISGLSDTDDQRDLEDNWVNIQLDSNQVQTLMITDTMITLGGSI
jgi:hypothetical protein